MLQPPQKLSEGSSFSCPTSGAGAAAADSEARLHKRAGAQPWGKWVLESGARPLGESPAKTQAALSALGCRRRGRTDPGAYAGRRQEMMTPGGVSKAGRTGLQPPPSLHDGSARAAPPGLEAAPTRTPRAATSLRFPGAARPFAPRRCPTSPRRPQPPHPRTAASCSWRVAALAGRRRPSTPAAPKQREAARRAPQHKWHSAAPVALR